MPFPIHRMRRTRKNGPLRRLFEEVRPRPSDFILPIFVDEGLKSPREVPSMPGVFRHSLASFLREAEAAKALGLPAVLLFGVPSRKDPEAKGAYHRTGIVQKALRALKKEVPGIVAITDVCACEYTTHGHCGLLTGGDVDNDRTIALLGKIAVSHAEAGADIVAPSDMMDGRVAKVRSALDAQGFTGTAILSYAAKFSSSFYGPFRDAADSAPAFGDRKTYQMPASNPREALREIELDIEEGADLVMVKPALTALDLIAKARNFSPVPVWGYHVSGEYSMVKAAEKLGWLSGEQAMAESLLAIKRAGADRVVTYWAKEAAKFFK